MKVALFDGIQEMHVIDSLERALISRGHDVYSTGKITSGFEYIENQFVIQTVVRKIDKIRDFAPDLIIVFRPSALPPDLLKLMRDSGAQIFAWFSDDPVLWNYTYKYSVTDYDAVLHCGGQQILNFYQEKFGKPTGVNFPFWTDAHAFSFMYGSKNAETDLVFLGNTNNKIRRQRYYDLSTIQTSIRIHGNPGPDYFKISGGYLDNKSELEQMGATSKIAINIPQYFEDYRDTDSWFEGLSRLGSFEIPSRIVQCAAMGLPVVSIEPGKSSASSFQSMIRVADISECNEAVLNLLQDGNLNEISRQTNLEFRQYFSAHSRVLALEELMHSSSWRSLSTNERAVWYRRFPHLDHDLEDTMWSTDNITLDPDSQVSRHGGIAATNSNQQTTGVIQNSDQILIIGERWNERLSSSTVLARCLTELGYEVTKFDSTRNGADFTSLDPTGLFRRLIDVDSFVEHSAKNFSCVIFVGETFYPSTKNLKNLPIIYHALSATTISFRLLKICSVSDHVTFLNSSTVELCESRGIRNTIHFPDLVDDEIITYGNNNPKNKQLVSLVIQRGGHRSLYQEIINPLMNQGARMCVVEDFNSKISSDLFDAISSDLVVFLPDPSREGTIGSRLIGHSLMLAGQTAVFREGTHVPYLPNNSNSFLFSDLQELALKVSSSNRNFADSSYDTRHHGIYTAMNFRDKILSKVK